MIKNQNGLIFGKGIGTNLLEACTVYLIGAKETSLGQVAKSGENNGEYFNFLPQAVHLAFYGIPFEVGLTWSSVYR